MFDQEPQLSTLGLTMNTFDQKVHNKGAGEPQWSKGQRKSPQESWCRQMNEEWALTMNM